MRKNKKDMEALIEANKVFHNEHEIDKVDIAILLSVIVIVIFLITIKM